MSDGDLSDDVFGALFMGHEVHTTLKHVLGGGAGWWVSMGDYG